MGEGSGYDDGYNAGYDAGFDANAYQEGYNDGEAAGYATGYDTGYTEGAASVNSVKTLIDTRDASYLFARKVKVGGSTLELRVKMLNNNDISRCLKHNDTQNATSTIGMFAAQQDISVFPVLNTSNVTAMSYMFCDCFYNGGTPPLLNTENVENITCMFGKYTEATLAYNKMTSIPLYDFRKVKEAYNLFYNCQVLESIPALNFESFDTTNQDFNKKGVGYGWITGCSRLREIHIVDIHYSINITASTAFTREALVEIIGNLRDMTGYTALTLTMGSSNLAKLTEDDIAVATDKNWTVS
jgi:hypothetical protein